MLLPDRIHFAGIPTGIVLATPRKERVYTEEEVEAARKEAYQRGFTEAQSLIEQQMLHQRTEVMHLQQSTLRSLEAQYESLVGQLRLVIPELAMETVKRIFAGMKVTKKVVADIVNDVLHEVSPGPEPLEVLLSPHDFELIRNNEPDFREKYPGLEFKTDSGLKPGDCMARTRFGVIDGRIDTKLKNVGGVLK